MIDAILRFAHRISPWMLPGALAMAWVVSAVTQRFHSPELGAELATAAFAIPLTFWAFPKHYLNKRELRHLIPMSAPVGVMLVSAILADNPREALLGVPPLWQGWLLWVSVLGWLILVYMGSDWQDLIDSTRVLAVLGTVAALWALAERAGLLTPYDSLMGPAMALFDNPLSLAQALLVTVACSLSLAVRHIPTPRWLRATYVTAALIQVVAIIAADSTGPVVALAFGVAAYGVTERKRTRAARALFVTSTAVVIALVLAFVALTAAWSGAFGPTIFERADLVVNNRLSIWSDVAERAARHPTLGTGPSQFDTVVDWSVLSDGRVDAWFTYDQHSILLTWLLDVGLLGFVVFGIAAVTIAYRLIRVSRTGENNEPIRVLAAGCVATFIAMLSSWPDPIALVSITVIVGCLVSPYRSRLQHVTDEHDKPGMVALFAPGMITLMVVTFALISLAPDVKAQYRLTTADTSDDVMYAFSQALTDTKDPFYLEEELFAINASGKRIISDENAVDLIRSLDAHYPRHALHRVDIPLLALEILWERSDEMSEEEYWRLTRAFAERGVRSDPNLGIWKYDLARAAHTSGHSDTDVYVTAALRENVPDSARTVLESWR